MSWFHTSLFWQTVLRVVGLLGDFVGLYFGSLLVLTIFKRSRPRHAQRWMSFLGKLNDSKKDMQGWVQANEFPIALMFVSGMISVLAYGAIANRYPTEQWDNVRVEAKVGVNQWMMRTATGPNADGVLFTACPDFPNEQVIRPGYKARKIRFEERGKCKSIRAEGLGVWWERDAQGNVKEIENVTIGTAR